MTTDEVVAQIKSSLGPRLLSLDQPLENRVYLEVESQFIRDVAALMYRDLAARLQTASGVDGPKEMEILYHWAFDQLGLVITIRTRIPREQPVIDSIVEDCPTAEWIEREMWELLGISFEGHPDLRHLLLKDDWPEGAYPLRRDYRKE